MSLIFAHPVILFLLLFPALLLYWVWNRESGRIVLPLDHGHPRRGRRLQILVSFAESLPPLLLAVAILLLAGPQKLSQPKTKRVLTNIEFCVDISGSMTAEFGEGSRYDASMEAIDEFLNYREGDAFGLTFFGNSVLHWTPLTFDTSAIRCSPPFMRPETAPPWFNGTAIGKALRACGKVLTDREEGDRMIILVSDGYSSDLENGYDAEISRKLNDNNITVYAIHIAESEVPAPIVNITSLTGGEVFNPGDPEVLKGVFQRIDEMQKTRLEKVSSERMDDFFPVSLVGLVLLGATTLCLFGVRYTPW